jgi:hypothetical protein
LEREDRDRKLKGKERKDDRMKDIRESGKGKQRKRNDKEREKR